MTTANTEGLSARLREHAHQIGNVRLAAKVLLAADALDAKDKLLDEAEKALEPFAAEAERIAEHNPGWDHDDFQLRVGSRPSKLGPYRAARGLIAKIREHLKP